MNYAARGNGWRIGDPLPEQGTEFYSNIDISELNLTIQNLKNRNVPNAKWYPSRVSIVRYGRFCDLEIDVCWQNGRLPPISREYNPSNETLTVVIDTREYPNTPYSCDQLYIPLQGVKRVDAKILKLEEAVKV